MNNILIVDDDARIRDVVRFALEDSGFQTTEEGTGQDALELFRKTPTDLAVLDIGMPEMDGLEACKELRKSSTVPILFLTARDDEIDRILGFQLGGDDYVTKPFSPREAGITDQGHPRSKGTQSPDDVTVFQDLRLDHSAHRCTPLRKPRFS